MTITLRRAALLVIAVVTTGFALGTGAPATSLNHPIARTDTATFAGGCFWSVEKVFDDMPGVVSATSGFMGGRAVNPSYNDVVQGNTGHAEAVQVVFDPARISYARLLHSFWRNIDPAAINRQFCDSGPQYRSIIFYGNPRQKEIAESTKLELQRSGRFRRIATTIQSATAFYPAEEYHQDFAKKNPGHYGRYRIGCGRDRALRAIWGAEAGG